MTDDLPHLNWQGIIRRVLDRRDIKVTRRSRRLAAQTRRRDERVKINRRRDR